MSEAMSEGQKVLFLAIFGREPGQTEGFPDVEKQEKDAGLKQRIEEVLKMLTYREREILKFRYGIGDSHTYTLEEVGKMFMVTRERVRQIEAKAISKLQHPVRARKLEGFPPPDCGL